MTAYPLSVLEPRHISEILARYSLGSDAELSGPVAKGEQGEVWRLTTSTGSWAVKRLFRHCSERDVAEDADYQDAVHAAAVPTPRVMRTVEGGILLNVEPLQFQVYSWVELLEPNPLLDPAAVGAVVAAIHRVPFTGHRPVHSWYTDAVGAHRWDELARALQESGAPFAAALAEIRDELIAMEALLEPPSKLQTCHRDLWAENLRGTPTDEVCVIDWHDCGLADPSQELALVLYQFAWRNAERALTLYRAYLDAGGPGRITGRGNFTMVIAQLGHINERACRRWLSSSASGEDRARAASLFGEFTDSPLTRGVIDELLDAVSPGNR